MKVKVKMKREYVELNINNKLTYENTEFPWKTIDMSGIDKLNAITASHGKDVITITGKDEDEYSPEYTSTYGADSIRNYNIFRNIVSLHGFAYPLTPKSMQFIQDVKIELPTINEWEYRVDVYSDYGSDRVIGREVITLVDADLGVIKFKRLTNNELTFKHIMFDSESLKKIIDVKCKFIPKLLYSKETGSYHFESFTGYENVGLPCKYPLEVKSPPNDVSTQTDFILDPILKKQEDIVKLCKATTKVCEKTINACNDFLVNVHQETDDPLLLGQDTLDINFDE
jgi:hypothetical protein